MNSWPKDKVFKSGQEFVDWLKTAYPNTVKNNIKEAHVHHTWSPNHSNTQSTLRLHQNMRKYHVGTNGWSDIAQHVTVGKDGKVVTGRPITKAPASATGHNGSSSWHPFMFETVGNFDIGHDKLAGKQLESVLAILHFFNVEKGKPIHLHNEFSSKTCPGTSISKAALIKEAKAYKPGKGGNVTVEGSGLKPSDTKPITVNSNSIRDYLVSIGESGSFEHRKELAEKRGITNYKGTAEQNLKLLDMLKAEHSGKSESKPSGGSIVDYLKAHNENGSFTNRKKLAAEYGIGNYSGTATQNTQLLEKMKAGKKQSATETIDVDGYWGKNTTKLLQEVLGTPVDGIISKQHKNAITTQIQGVTFGDGGSLVVKAMQKELGVTEDGNIGPATIRALQKRYGTPQDGKLSRPSLVVKAMQRALNQGKF